MAKTRSMLTPREARFIKEYLIDFNGAGAVRRAGYTYEKRDKVTGVMHDYSRQIAYELLTKPYIVAEINREMQKRTKKLDLNADFTLNRLKALSESNPLDVAQWAGGKLMLKDSASLTREQAYAIESLHMKQTRYGPEIKFKLRKPDVALEMLGRHQGLFDVGDQGKPAEEMEEAIKVLDEEEGKGT